MTTNRRKFLQTAGLSISVLHSASATTSGSLSGAPRLGKKAQIDTPDKAIVSTTNGKVQGYLRNGIYTYKGIPYGADTGGENRFLPPRKPKPWTGIRSALAYGRVSPHGPRAGWANDQEAFIMQWSDGIAGEDCLNLNVWTPGIHDTKKRPVMVWIHGGGYSTGSSQELPAYDGENLCHRGDVVVVSMNHRLNLLGFLDLSVLGNPVYADSGNVGMLDVIASLEWVRDNITQFGGDPGNVTIFGQSGGGGKVSTLMAMPAAKGLFHRAAVHSGSTLRSGTKEMTQQLTTAFLAELGIRLPAVDALKTLPYERLLEASTNALKKVSAQVGPNQRVGWGPVVDGKNLPHHPFDPGAPQVSSSVPMIIGTVANEQSPAFQNAPLEELTVEQVRQQVANRYGEKTDRILAAYQQAFPTVKPVEILSLINSPRINAVTQAERKTAQGGAPVYMYWFTWKTPVLGGRPRSFHCSDLAFVFDNIDRCENATGGGDEPRELAAKVSQAWINFARTGNPSHKGLPHWPAFTVANGETMILDQICQVKHDPDKTARQTLTT